MSPTSSTPRWYQDAVIYQLHIKAFADSNGDGIGDFRGLTSRLDYLQELGVTAIWLLPFYPSPLRDDGYDTADYRRVHESYGDMDQFRAFMTEAKARGLRVITELVLNHTSDQHEWFQRARRAPAGSPERDFYVWSDTPDRYSDTRIIFKDFETSNWSWDPVAGQYYWHRFYSHQPDLNWENPTVVRELYSIVDYWLDMGVDGLRLDAVPYLFEAEGTNCENLPATHQALKDLRAHVDANHDDKMLLAEANMWPDEVVDYFGDGDECHMAFHFPLMPRLYMAARMEDRFPIIDILDETPDIPDGAAWAIFLRNHDELTLEMVTDEERDYMWRIYAEDERARINLGIRRRLAPLLGNSRRQIELMNSLLFSLPGTPVIYYGDEIGMGDNIYLGDRDGVRTPMQWSPDRNAGFSDANPQRLYLPVVTDPEYHASTVNVEAQSANYESLLWWTRRMISTRKAHPALGHGRLEWVASENHKVLSYLRVADEERILCVVNLSRHAQFVELDLSDHVGARPISLPGRTEFPVIDEGSYGLSLGPHDYLWFVLDPAGPDDAERVRAGELPQVHVEQRWDEVIVGRHQAQLEAALPAYLAERRWFRSKARRIRSAQVVEAIPVPVASVDDAVGYVTIVEVDYSTGEPERYVLPLIAEPMDARAVGVLTTDDIATLLVIVLPDGRRLSLHDALANVEFSAALGEAVFARRELHGASGGLFGTATAALDQVRAHGTSLLPVTHVSGQHSNSTIEFGDTYVLKLYRMVEEGGSPDVELARFLNEQTDCELAPVVGGTLHYRQSDGEGLFAGRASTVAVVQERIDHRGDAWTVTLDELRRFGELALAQPDVPELPHALVYRRAHLEPTPQALELIGPYLETARLLGERTAELHAALASAPEGTPLAPEPVTPMYRRSLYQSMRGSAKRTFEALRRLERSRPELTPILDMEQVVTERLRRLLDVGLDERRIRGHGDFHLGQVLVTGRDVRIIDFEGEPLRPVGERRIKRSALKDVASMVRSFDYVACTVLDELRGHGDSVEETPARERLTTWLEFWYRWVSATFVRSYLDAAAEHGFLPTSEADLETMLDAMLLEKALYELLYEANSRPEWMWIPMRSLTRRIRGDISAG